MKKVESKTITIVVKLIKIMKFTLNSFRWVSGLFFFIGFFAYFKESVPASFCFLLMSILLLPPTENFIFSHLKYPVSRKIKVVVLIAIFILAIIFSPNKSANNSQINYQKLVIPTPSVTATPTADQTTPTITPTLSPTNKPTVKPTSIPTIKPTLIPTFKPTIKPILKPTSIPIVTKAPIINNQTNNSTYSCDCKKTCTEISSCAEAQYLLNTCSCHQRDKDGDGIACDGAPLHCQN